MRNPNDPRHFARWIALQKLFNKSFFRDREIDVFDDETIKDLNETPNIDNELMESIVDGVAANTDKLNTIISQLAPERPISEIAKVDLNILYIAIFEGFIAKTTPERVAIDEAIELAKEFGGEHSYKFVNGVLGTIIKDKDKFKDLLN